MKSIFSATFFLFACLSLRQAQANGIGEQIGKQVRDLKDKYEVTGQRPQEGAEAEAVIVDGFDRGLTSGFEAKKKALHENLFNQCEQKSRSSSLAGPPLMYAMTGGSYRGIQLCLLSAPQSGIGYILLETSGLSERIHTYSSNSTPAIQAAQFAHLEGQCRRLHDGAKLIGKGLPFTSLSMPYMFAICRFKKAG